MECGTAGFSQLQNLWSSSACILWVKSPSAQFVEQAFRVLQIGGVQSLGEPIENWREKVVCFDGPAL